MTAPESTPALKLETPENWVWLARIRQTQGRKGEVFCEILTDFPEKFADRKQLWLLPASAAPKTASRVAAISAPRPASPRAVELVHQWLHKGGIVLHFAGVDSISDAELLKGLIVAIPATERAPLSEDEYYIGDLVGCQLIDVAGVAPVTVGAITDVDRSAGPVALLVVEGKQGEVLVPFAKGYLKAVDIAAKRVEMALPEGLVDLNTTTTKQLAIEAMEKPGKKAVAKV